MHVVINALFLVPPMGGLETYLRELCREFTSRPSPPQLTVLLSPDGYAGLEDEPWAGSAQLVECPRLGRNGVKALSEMFAFGPVADLRRAQVIHSIAMTGPLFSRAARVVTVPDVIWLTHPSPGATHGLWRRIVPPIARRADRVIAISHAGASEVTRTLGIAPEQIDVTLLGAGTPPQLTPRPAAELRAELGLGDGPLILNVGQKGVHRNLDRLIHALATVRRTHPEAVLVLPGPASAEAEERLRGTAAGLGISDALHLPGFVDDAALEGLYAAADAFVMPSLVEGFGLPVLEAMQRGAPVACSEGSAPGEVAGDAAVLFDPLDETSIARSIEQLLGDPDLRARLVERGHMRAAEFTWSRCADQTLESYARAQA